jgi:hypothetical protein
MFLVRFQLHFALSERARAGAKPKLHAKQQARLIATACLSPPQGHKRWTMQLLADQLLALQVVETIWAETVDQ